jgi:hypothetical protein
VSPDAASYDRREEVADEREREADQREARLEDRERRADEREAGLDELAQKLHTPAVSRQERSLQAIDRARVMLSEGGSRPRSIGRLRKAPGACSIRYLIPANSSNARGSCASGSWLRPPPWRGQRRKLPGYMTS